MNVFMICLVLIGTSLVLYPAIVSRIKQTPTTYEQGINRDGGSGFKEIDFDDRWDGRALLSEIEDPQALENLKHIGQKIVLSSPPLQWILTEPPQCLTMFAVYCCNEEELDESDDMYQFWKFMCEPGMEILLTEAAYRGYLPAMSILASYCENQGRSQDAEYWQKFGEAHLNPTSILLRGLNLTIQGKLRDDVQLEQGRGLIVLAHMLGEEIACKISGFERLVNTKPFGNYDKQDILAAIYDIEKNDRVLVEKRLVGIRAAVSKDNVSMKDLIDVLLKINEILDSPNVSVMEIAVLVPLKEKILEEMRDAQADNPEFLDSLNKAELGWRLQRVGAGSNFVSDTILPMVFIM